MLTEHILSLHASSKSKASGQSSNWKGTQTSEPQEKSLKSRLRLDNEAEVDLLPTPLLRKYIAYAREYVNPTLDEDARQEVENFYLELRRSHYANDSTPVTPRQLESLARLTQARAKAELREVATRHDALDVIELVRASFDDVIRDQCGALDFTRSLNGSGMSSRNEVINKLSQRYPAKWPSEKSFSFSKGKKFIEALQMQAKSTGTITFSWDELKAVADRLGVGKNKSFSSFVDNLNHHCLLISVGNKRYKLAVDY